MPLQFEHRWLRTFLVFILLAILGLQIWYLFIDQPAKFAALAAANVFTIQKIEQFNASVSWAAVDQTLQNAIVISSQARQFENDTRNRVANMNNWAASANRTSRWVEQITKDLEQFKSDLAFSIATSEDYGWLTKVTAYNIEARVNEILREVHANRTSIKIAGDQAAATHETLNQKIVTQPEADKLKRQAAVLQKQNKELRKKKATVFKLFLHQ